VPRERDEAPRDLAPALRDFVTLLPLFARDAVDEDLRTALPVGLAALDRGLAALEDFVRAVVLRPLLAFRVPLLRDVPADDEPRELPLLEPSSALHLPDITRCAASATASAMIEPSFVALDITLLAARSAVSAASRPASRIFLRADGLALIAAAAAARPAASISLLIAALASLSTVLLLELERDDDEREPDEDLPREELLRADFAIFYLPPLREKTL